MAPVQSSLQNLSAPGALNPQPQTLDCHIGVLQNYNLDHFFFFFGGGYPYYVYGIKYSKTPFALLRPRHCASKP